MRSSTSMNQYANNLQNSQLKKSTAAIEDESYFNRNIRQTYDDCKDCPMNKQENHVCISPKCPYYFKLVCPYCHKQNHLVDPIMTYQIQDVDLFMQEIVKITRQKKNLAKKQRDKNKLYDVIDEKIKQIDNLIQAIESIKNVLQFKKVVMGQVFKEYDLVYDELLKLYKPSNHFTNINKMLDFLNKMFHYQKGTGSNRQWSLQFKNDVFIQENFIKPLEELDLRKNSEQGQLKKMGQMNTISESKNEDRGSNESRENIESQSEHNQKFQQKFNQAIDSIENTLNQLTNYTNNFLKSEDFAYLSSVGSVEDHIKDEKQKCVTECNKILKEYDIHFQWETFVKIQNHSQNENNYLGGKIKIGDIQDDYIEIYNRLWQTALNDSATQLLLNKYNRALQEKLNETNISNFGHYQKYSSQQNQREDYSIIQTIIILQKTAYHEDEGVNQIEIKKTYQNQLTINRMKQMNYESYIHD
ncbi:hypothetical protein ABPG74_016754 [Tetrahymena malaccensis]